MTAMVVLGFQKLPENKNELKVIRAITSQPKHRQDIDADQAGPIQLTVPDRLG
jgi:hypothetical protein